LQQRGRRIVSESSYDRSLKVRDALANKDHLTLLNRGRVEWNNWRDSHPADRPDLRGLVARSADLSWITFQHAILEKADLMRSNLNKARLEGAELQGALLNECDLREASLNDSNLEGANLAGADLRKANLSGANARRADFTNADLSGADLSRCDLEEASLIGARLVRTKLCGANLCGCYVYGISVWDVDLQGAAQLNLVITPFHEHSPDNPYEAERIPTHLSSDRECERSEFLTAAITVDRLEVAAFIYLLLNNKAIRDVLDTITSKAVLILGRFTPERKRVLDVLRDHLRKRNYLPILFDFDGPLNRDTTETMSILAHLARFVIADISNPRSVPHELMKIVPNLPSLPIQPILAAGDVGYSMFQDLKKYPWVLDTVKYDADSEGVEAVLDATIRGPELWLERNRVSDKSV
jgi:uncharacterized protein YjbI with pentapeptide repeats